MKKDKEGNKKEKDNKWRVAKFDTHQYEGSGVRASVTASLRDIIN
jgi:hypothetical protein